MEKLIIPVGMLLIANSVQAQLTPIPNTENYIQSKTYLDYNGTTPTKSSETVQYFDGLGRPKQVINIKASPKGRDVVTHIEYDGFGRQTKDYLPVPQSGTLNGVIVPTPLANASSTPYGTEKIYAEKILENSPLNRIQQQIQVGNDWTNKPVTFQYDTNAQYEVYKFTTNTTWVNNVTVSTLTYDFFPPNQLYKTTVTDEDGNITKEYKNAKGQVIMVRKFDGTYYSDTYYVYNEYDQLAFVIPPKAIHQSITDTLLNDLCYQYRYDGRNRLVEKKLPGKGWEQMIYNKRGQIVYSRDANLKNGIANFVADQAWNFTKYDKFGRPVYTGICRDGTDRQIIQQAVDNQSIDYETRGSSLTMNGMTIEYGNTSYPTYLDKILSVNYYDTYPQGAPAIPAQILEEDVLPQNAQSSNISTKSLPTASYVKNIEDDNWTKSYTYYDTKGRAVGTYSINHLGGYTKTESKLDFAGVPQSVITKHKRLSTDTERVITETFTYDPQNRLLVHKHKVDNNIEEILAQNTYNELSQLESKKVGGISLASPLQTIDYKYNIRGWMTHINDPAVLGSDLFGYKINYNQVEGLETPNSDFTNLKVKPKYNGNIAEVSWKTLTEENEPLKRYGYVYDPLNRLSAGFYQKAGNENAKEYFERMEYDLNGNITRLQRSAGLLTGSTIALSIDNLKYDYTGNKLTKVTEEQIGNNNGYPYLAAHNSITYDDNGSMASHKDKGITSIEYNFLNLAKKFSYSYGGHSYKYRADGVKVEKESYYIIPNETYKVHYFDAFQYSDYNDNKIFGLDFVPTAEGYFDFRKNLYIYNYADHLGNVRLSYSDSNKDGILQPRDASTEHCIDLGGGMTGCTTIWIPGEIAEVNDYYPFGLKHERNNNSNVGLNPYQYKYNGKELQETGMYDYGARFYMPDIGRWGVIDPLTEETSNWSPFAYGFNNPIRFIDPTGMSNNDIIKIDVKTGSLSIIDTKGNDVVQLVENGKVVDSYKYGKDGSFLKENKVTNLGKAYSSEKGYAISFSDYDKANTFYKFAAKSQKEFGLIDVFYPSNMSGETTVMTTFGKTSVGASNYAYNLLEENPDAYVGQISHSHTAPFDPTTFYPASPSGFDGATLKPTGDSGDRQGYLRGDKYKDRRPEFYNIYIPSAPNIDVKYNGEKVIRKVNKK